MDIITKEKRSWNMSLIKSKNTKPELIVRRYLFNQGLRYRLHGKISKRIFPNGILPGKPDIVLRQHKAVVFVNGCFWHAHENCNKNHLPKTNTNYWSEKVKANIIRDQKNYFELEKLGFKVLIIWECELASLHCLEQLRKDIQGE